MTREEFQRQLNERIYLGIPWADTIADALEIAGLAPWTNQQTTSDRVEGHLTALEEIVESHTLALNALEARTKRPCPEVDGTGEDDGITGVLRPACLTPPASEPEAWGEEEAHRLWNVFPQPQTSKQMQDWLLVAAEAARIEAEHASELRAELERLQDALVDCDPEDSRALLQLRQLIDKHLGWRNFEQEEAGDYAARIVQIGEDLAAAREECERLKENAECVQKFWPPSWLPSVEELEKMVHVATHPNGWVCLDGAAARLHAALLARGAQPAAATPLPPIPEGDAGPKALHEAFRNCWRGSIEEWDTIGHQNREGRRAQWHAAVALLRPDADPARINNNSDREPCQEPQEPVDLRYAGRKKAGR